MLVVAGEASGDLHAARLLAALLDQRPDLAPFGLGGGELQAAGMERLADSAEITVVGITEVLKILPRAREIFAQILAEVDRRRPPLAILVDFPEFNLRLARQLQERGVKVIYYISPQIWAWRRGRLRQIARVVDRMLVLFPFEERFYAQADVPVSCVGHPLVDEVPRLESVWAEAGGAVEPPFRLALLPGSRRSEVEALLPSMVRAAELLAANFPLEVSLLRAPTAPAARIAELLAASELPIRVVSDERFTHLARCHLALCASGTATLELGLLGIPMVVVYRLQRWTYWLARLLVRLPYFSLVNLVLEEGVVPELLQREAEPENVARVAGELLAEPPRLLAMHRSLAPLRSKLGASGASERAAAEVLRELSAVVPATPHPGAEADGAQGGAISAGEPP